MAPKDLIKVSGSVVFLTNLNTIPRKLKYSKNAEGQYHCPVTYKTFTNNSKIAAVATSGNVYSYSAIEELNVKSKNWNVSAVAELRHGQ